MASPLALLAMTMVWATTHQIPRCVSYAEEEASYLLDRHAALAQYITIFSSSRLTRNEDFIFEKPYRPFLFVKVRNGGF